MVFFLAAAWHYLAFTRKGYAWGSGFFVAALLTKSVTATLPGGIAVALWWRRERLERYRGLAPWLAVGVAAGAFTAWMEHSVIGAQGAEFALAWWQRGLLACRATGFYLGKLAWPVGLNFVYPKWTISPGDGWAVAVVAAMTAGGVVRWLRSGRRGPLAAWLYFGGTLLPALGFVNVYPFLFSYVADHFQYFACLGPLALAGAGMAAVNWTAAVIVPALVVLSARQAAKYRSAERLYRATLAENPAAWMADNNLGEVLVAAGKNAEARAVFERALALRPNYPEAENNLGYVDALDGAYPSAIGHFERALQLQPKFPAAEYNLANALLAENRPEAAVAHLRRAVALQPTYAEAGAALAYEEARSGDAESAIRDYERALASPAPFTRAAAAHAQLALLLAQAHREIEAKAHFETSLLLDPSDPTTHNNYGILLASEGDLSAAKREFAEAVRLAPDFEEAKQNLFRASSSQR